MEGRMTIGQKYGPAMEITNQTEADRYFEECVQHTMSSHGKSRDEAERIEKANLGYYAGYYDDERIFRAHLVKFLNRNLWTVLEGVGKSILQEATEEKAKALAELDARKEKILSLTASANPRTGEGQR